MGQLVVENITGETIRIIVTDKNLAGRFWFLKKNELDLIVVGPALVEALSMESDGVKLTYEYDQNSEDLILVSPINLKLSSHELIAPYSSKTLTTMYKSHSEIELPVLPSIDMGIIRDDTSESLPDYDDSTWVSWEGQPRSLEELDIFRGHAWYRARLDLDEALAWFNRGRIFIEHASDIVGIYINGKYVVTINPVGTEIDSHSLNSNYRFDSAKEYLQQGSNIIAFRTEVWGHGSFMFPQGKLIGTQMQLPSVGYEGKKGLFGEASIGGNNLESWSVRSGLGGARAEWFGNSVDLSKWEPSNVPLQLEKGQILWYRTTFRTGDLSDTNVLRAPIVAELVGLNTKATIYLNGKVIGRWLSDTEWLQRGCWARPMVGMWIANEANHYPLPRQMLRENGVDNDLVIVLEDASSGTDAPGILSSLRLRYNFEKYDWHVNQYQRGVAVHGRSTNSLE